MLANNSSGRSDEPDCALYKLWISFVFGSIVFIIGVTGNILSFIILSLDSKKTPTNFILCCLAVFDTIVVIVRFINKSLSAYSEYFKSWESFEASKPWFYTYGWPVNSVSHLAATLTTVLVTGHRWLAVKYPHNSKYSSLTATRFQMTIISIFSLLFTLPRFFESQVQDGKQKRLPWIKGEFYKYFYTLFLYYTFIYVMPLLSLIFMTYELIEYLKSNIVKREMSRQIKDGRDITRTLIVVVLIFIICQITNPIRRLLVALEVNQGCGSFYSYYSEFSSFAVMFNSAINFIIYIIFSRRFRKTFLFFFKRSRIDVTSLTQSTQRANLSQISKH